MIKVKGIIGTHQWGVYVDNKLVSVHPCQNNAVQAKQALLYK